jgi:hypothetical protein
MTSRHHQARFESRTDASLVYTFTPDSTKQCVWGRVRFNLANYSHEILDLAQDCQESADRQLIACSALAHKLRRARNLDASAVPLTLEFVA